ncbi:MAG: leucine--tRNA ligase [Alphaproteobacteria bacterium]|nr:leucine--tRNA ligase [Rickettsiales bacterium]
MNNKNTYVPYEIEKKWQTKWSDSELFAFDEERALKGKDNFYVLEMLPYPSGKLHMGHVRNYTAGDVVTRFRKMQGYNVLHTIGWDAFGLPAENAAIASNSSPKEWVTQNIEQMKKQLKKLGLSYEWNREISTCDPDYYKHGQSIFIDFLKADLAYQKDSIVNWDPIDQTVLANEQVINGCGWRSKAPVVKKKLKQWFFRISDFSQELLDDLETLDQWPEQVKTMQSNWIGRSQGIEFIFNASLDNISNFAKEVIKNITKVEVFSTRPETLFGCSFAALSPQHQITQSLLEHNEEIKQFVQQCEEEQLNNSESEPEKKGIFAGFYVKHPLSNISIKIDGKEIKTPKIQNIPVYIANFVLSTYGSGAIFGCPAQDKRDMKFAEKYQLPTIQIVNEGSNQTTKMINSFFLDGYDFNLAKQTIIKVLEALKIGTKQINYKLHDWGISRQRYWGCPIPVVYCNKCGTIPEKKANLPIKLPDDVKFSGNGNPLALHPTWKHCKCPQCGQDAERETDTFDTFFESSWYFIRYMSPNLSTAPFSKAIANKMLPVNEYIGGIEHAILHLMYARFFTKALTKIGLLSISEPFKRLTTQGMVCHRAYQAENREWVNPKDVITENGKLVHKETKIKVIDRGVTKMGKSSKNVIDPDDMINVYGADAIRLFILSNTPLDKNIEWSNKSAQHCLHYLTKIWETIMSNLDIIKKYGFIDTEISATDKPVNLITPAENSKLLQVTHETIKEYTKYIENFKFNKAISLLYILHNEIENTLKKTSNNVNNSINKNNQNTAQAIVVLIQLISLFAPHFAQEAWEQCGQKEALITKKWPIYNKNTQQGKNINIGIQINGKLRDSVTVQHTTTVEQYKEIALAKPKIKQTLLNKQVKKIIVVPKRIINIVVTNNI